MDVVIIADYCGSFDGGFNSRFLYLAQKLSHLGHKVEVITSDFDHGKKQKFVTTPEGFPYKITMLSELGYKKNICIRRFASDYIWGNNVRKYLKARKSPDVIYIAVPPLKGAYDAAVYCEKKKIRSIIDIQDLWPEAYRMVFNIPIISNVIFAPFVLLANGIYKRSDVIVGVSQTYVDRAVKVSKKCSKGTPVFLGTDLKKFDEYATTYSVKRDNRNELWIAYCGTLGASYDLNIVFDALRILDDETIHFIVMGDGPRREEFEINSKGLNVTFTGLLPYQEMCGLLCACDIAVNPIMKRAAQSIINKHGDYAAAGIPVINTQECEEYKELITQYKMGFNCDNNHPEKLAYAISYLKENIIERQKMGKAARLCAEQLFDRGTQYEKLISLIVNDCCL